MRAELRGEVDSSLRDRAGAIAQLAGGRGGAGGAGPAAGADGPGPAARSRPAARAVRRTRGLRPARAARRAAWCGRPGADDALPVDARARAIARSGSGEYLTDTTVSGTHLRVLTRGARRRRGAIQVARPLDEVDRQLDRVLLVLLLVGAAGVALGAGPRRARGPDRARADRQLHAPHRGARRRPATPRSASTSSATDELGRLARSFNTTLDALERSVEAQRHLVADASHELRTPIASLRANIQTLEHAERLPAAERASRCGRTSSRSWTS